MPSVEAYYRNFRRLPLDELRKAFAASLAIFRSSRGRDRDLDYAILLAAHDACVQRGIGDWAKEEMQVLTTRPVLPVPGSEEVKMSFYKGKASAAVQATEIPSAENHAAVVCALIDLGTHTETYTDKAKGTTKTYDARKVYVVWELVNERMADMKDTNHVIAKDYSVGFAPNSKLRQLMETIKGSNYAEGEEIDVSKLLGRKCMVDVKHNTSQKGRTYAKVDSVAKPVKDVKFQEPKRKPFIWEVGDDITLIEWVPYLYGEPVADVIGRCHELHGDKPANGSAKPAAQTTPAATEAEEVPF